MRSHANWSASQNLRRRPGLRPTQDANQALTIIDDSFSQEKAYRIAYRVGLDCIPQVRRRIIDRLRGSTDTFCTTTELARERVIHKEL